MFDAAAQRKPVGTSQYLIYMENNSIHPQLFNYHKFE